MLLKTRYRHNKKDAARVAACVMGDRDTPSMVVMVNETGDLIDTMTLPALHQRVPTRPDRAAAGMGGGGGAGVTSQTAHAEYVAVEILTEQKTADQTRLQTFVRTHKPHVVVVAATSDACLQVPGFFWRNKMYKSSSYFFFDKNSCGGDFEKQNV